MKKQDIRNEYTRKVAELLNQGWTIFPDTMSGTQGEIAHIDLTDGSEIRRVLLERDMVWEHRDGTGYRGDVIRLTVGKAGKNTWVGDRWDGTIWNQHLEPIFQIEWAWLNEGRKGEWYTTIEEGAQVSHLRWERHKARATAKREALGDAFKSAALKWIRKQPRMKSCRPEDIEKVERVWDDNGRRSLEITAKGKRYTLR